MASIVNVIRTLRSSIENPKRKTVKKFISWCLETFINEQNLQNSIDGNVDILTLAMNHYGLGHNRVTNVLRLALKMNWSEVEDYLTDANKIRTTISKNDKCRQILSTPKGIDYLNRCCASTYDRLYDFVWL